MVKESYVWGLFILISDVKGLVLLRLGRKDSYNWGLVFLRLVVSNCYLWGLVFLRLMVRDSYVWGREILTFGG